MTAPARDAVTDPATAIGSWTGMLDVIRRPGTLDAQAKALLCAAAAAARGQAGATEREVARVVDLDGAALLEQCAAILVVSRGREAAALLLAGRPSPASDDAPATAPTVDDVEDAIAHFVPGGGAAPPFVALLADEAPDALIGYRALREAMYAGPLEARLVELALFTVGASGYQTAHAAVHAAKAAAHGASRGQLVEAGLCAVPAAGMSAWLIAADVISRLEAGS